MSFAQTLETRSPQAPTAPVAPRALANNEPSYLKLRNIKVGTEIAHVKDFTLKREAGTFTFKSGAFQFVEAVNGKITGAVFVGDATFVLTPPIDLERRNLAILTGGQPFEERFTSAVLRFTEGSEEEIRKAGTGDSSSMGGDADGLLGDVQQQLKKKLKENLAARLLEDVLSDRPGGKFIAFIHGKKRGGSQQGILFRRYSDKMIYDVDPQGALDVSRNGRFWLITMMFWAA